MLSDLKSDWKDEVLIEEGLVSLNDQTTDTELGSPDFSHLPLKNLLEKVGQASYHKFKITRQRGWTKRTIPIDLVEESLKYWIESMLPALEAEFDELQKLCSEELNTHKKCYYNLWNNLTR